MNKSWVLFSSVAVILIALAILWGPSAGTIYALCVRNIEFILFAHDADTGEPIPGAVITVRVQEYRGKDRKDAPLRLTTDGEGRARVLRENASCEDVIRPFRKTVTLFDGGWCDFDVEAAGYYPLENVNLLFGDFRHEDKGYSQAERLQRVEYKIPLARKK